MWTTANRRVTDVKRLDPKSATTSRATRHTGAMGAQAGLVGRDAERHQMAAAIAAAAGGRPSALLVSGEAGIGKTRLVAEATTAVADPGISALWGRCVRFGTDVSAFQPIGHLLTQWFRQADPVQREQVLGGLPAGRLATIAPILGRPSQDEPGPLVALAASVLERVSHVAPTVIVVDDLQWADASSLDVLAHLVAGFAPGQQLSLIGTYRDTDLHEGHGLHGWLADIRRLPMVQAVALDPLGLQATEQLVAKLCGEGKAVVRGADVFERSGGNPYLIELLALAPPEGAPNSGALKDALLASWHRLGEPARRLAQLLAVGGGPVELSVLDQLAAARQLPRETVRRCLIQLTAGGIATLSATGRAGLRHPLLSEVLLSTLALPELHEIHAEYAALWERSESSPLAARSAHLALHHSAAHHADEAFTWSLRAAAAAAELFAWSEECEHLHRACRLWPDVDPGLRGSDTDRVQLLRRASDSALRGGQYHLALELREEALRRLDQDQHPLDAVRLHIHREALQRYCGLHPTMSFDPEMLTLAERVPTSPEYAITLALKAFADVWAGSSRAADDADRAVRLAQLTRSDEALAWALAVRSQTRQRTLQGLADAELAVRHARTCPDRLLLATAANCRSNVLLGLGRRSDAADTGLDVYQELMRTGSFHESLGLLRSTCQLLIDIGRWSEAGDLLREALSRRILSVHGGELRRAAADLAARTGDLDAAGEHLTRARELAPGRQLTGHLMVRAETRVALAMGDQLSALALLAEATPACVAAGDAEDADELLVWAARAAADLAMKPGEHGNAVAWPEKIDALRGETPARFVERTPDDRLHPAWACLFAAEAARCRDGGSRRPDLWQEAVSRTTDADMPWERALCGYRLAQSLLFTSGNRPRASAALRDAARTAERLGATPLLAAIEALARQAHIALAEPAEARAGDGSPPALGHLTPREEEVLRQLVAGRTYSEIARSLFISDKTVSTHVSHLLRKTGTSTRIELADLADRADRAERSGPTRRPLWTRPVAVPPPPTE